MRFSNPSFKKKIGNFQFFQNVPQKFSSLNLFFLLFGFFLGNLSPQGLFFQSVPFFFPLSQEDFGKKETSEMKESKSFEYKVANSWSRSDEKSEERIFANKKSRPIDNQLNKLSETNTSWSLIGIFNAFPGPAPTILLWSEIFNWLSFRLFSFQNLSKNTFFQKRGKNEKEWVFFDSIGKTQKPNHQSEKISNEKNGQFYSSNLHFFLRSLNSIKIGFLLGIFVDAFKVGS